MTLLALVLALAGLPVLAATFYLAALTIIARLPWRGPQVAATRPRRRFVIVVPAHNEAAGIGQTLSALDGLDWHPDYRRVLVVADNCTDRTAAMAVAHGAEVLERHDAARRGKGYALDFAFRRLLSEGANDWHAAVVVDADSVVSPNLLRECSAHFDRGARAVQAAYLPVPRNGALAAITQIALTAMHVVRGAARERLALSAGLKGNGMAFTRALLAATPHAAYSRTEDLEFGVQLALAGTRVAYAGHATVWGDMPVSDRIATRQRERWIGGRMEVARQYVGRLLGAAVRRRSLLRLDAAIDLLVPPVSVLAVAAVAGTVLSTGAMLAGAWMPLSVWGAALVLLAVHVLDAAVRAGRVSALRGLALAIPRYALDKLFITLRAPAHFGAAWIRTARAGEAS
jgi:cellulose synthase/poly-beta-1,6-N-acetylglucosamine synthase-like glycosyltransferase